MFRAIPPELLRRGSRQLRKHEQRGTCLPELADEVWDTNSLAPEMVSNSAMMSMTNSCQPKYGAAFVRSSPSIAAQSPLKASSSVGVIRLAAGDPDVLDLIFRTTRILPHSWSAAGSRTHCLHDGAASMNSKDLYTVLAWSRRLPMASTHLFGAHSTWSANLQQTKNVLRSSVDNGCSTHWLKATLLSASMTRWHEVSTATHETDWTKVTDLLHYQTGNRAAQTAGARGRAARSPLPNCRRYIPASRTRR